MKKSKRYMVHAGRIHSLQDLGMEKMRIRMEIMKTEERIHSGYRDILHAFTFKNLAHTVIDEFSTTSSVLSKAFSFGKSFISGDKKKKNVKVQEVPDDDGT